MAYSTTLTPREREVLILVAQRLTNKKIAEQLAINIESVQGRLKSAMNRLGAEDRHDAVALATERGLLNV